MLHLTPIPQTNIPAESRPGGAVQTQTHAPHRPRTPYPHHCWSYPAVPPHLNKSMPTSPSSVPSQTLTSHDRIRCPRRLYSSATFHNNNWQTFPDGPWPGNTCKSAAGSEDYMMHCGEDVGGTYTRSVLAQSICPLAHMSTPSLSYC